MKIKGTIELNTDNRTVIIKLENGSYCIDYFTNGAKSFLDCEFDCQEQEAQEQTKNEEEPTMKVQFKNYTCNVLFSKYAHHDNIAIQLVDERDGQPVATATVNPDFKLDKDVVCIKDYSENEGMLAALMEAGIVSPPIGWNQLGFITAPFCRLLVPVLEEKLIGSDDIYKIKWVAFHPEFTTYEFVTENDVYIEEAEMDTDLFRLFIWKSGEAVIQVANSEDYDVHEVVTHLFDVDSIQAACEVAEPDIEDETADYRHFYAEREFQEEQEV